MTVSDCAHRRSKLMALDAGRGGVQYRVFCLACWKTLDGPIGHDVVARQQTAHRRSPRLHVDGSVVWAEVLTSAELAARRKG
jgi:hypothetical protein